MNNIAKLIEGIEKDLNAGYYKEGDIICFDLVVVYNEFRIRSFYIDNKYKLSKAILDIDKGREAVIIPLDIQPLILNKSTLEEDIVNRFIEDEKYLKLYCENNRLIKKLIKVVNSRYRINESYKKKNC
ncbi:TPA: hypothetical protein N2D99_002001 [Clostridium botulinum]|nr:hypothetical protein [Clostridium botulinum]